VPGTDYEALQSKQAELIRKSLKGSVFIASIDAGVPARLTDATDSKLAPLPTATAPATFMLPWGDLGFLSNDGAQFSSDVASSDVTSWGSTTPTRSDITSDNSTLTVVAQETKLTTIGLYTGADLHSGSTEADGELIITKGDRPKSKHYRVLSVAVDEGDAGDIYIGRLLARAKVNGKAEQAFGGGDDPIGWGVTFQGTKDSLLGFSERWFFGGPGWNALLTQMGFDAVGA
jgi:hypothetical protein